MELFVSSSAFPSGGVLPRRYTTEGLRISPPLAFSGIPPEAKELVLSIEERFERPDKSRVLWLVGNIPAQCSGFPEGNIPDGMGMEYPNFYGLRCYSAPFPTYESIWRNYSICLRALKEPISQNVHIPAEDLIKAAERLMVCCHELQFCCDMSEADENMEICEDPKKQSADRYFTMTPGL